MLKLLTRSLSSVAMIVLPAWALAQPALIVPDNATAPFERWSRGSSNSAYAHWDLFTSATEANSPDIGQYGAAEATLTETTAGASGAFISGSLNIYSFSAATSFDVVMPGLGLGSGHDSRFVTQIVTLGSELDYDSVVLSYDGGAQQLSATQTTELGRLPLGGFGGDLVTTLFVWDLNGNAPGEWLLHFDAAGSSMSLDQVVIDVVADESTALVGDYDQSGGVDALDYALWRTQFGTIGPQADGNGDGLVDLADYNVWREASAGPGLAAGGATSVPEPSQHVLLLCVAAAALFGLGCDRFFKTSHSTGK